MLRLNQLYFRNFFILFFATLLLVAVAGFFILKDIEVGNHKMMLIKMIDFFELQNDDDLEQLVKEVKEKTGIRVTVIGHNGVVLAESDKNKTLMENHSTREEIQKAKMNYIGSSVRYSKSIKTDLLYVAKQKSIDDHLIYIRMAYPLEQIHKKFYDFWAKATLIFAFSLFFAFYIAFRINKNTTQDVNKTKEHLSDLLNKNFEVELHPMHTTEFDTIGLQLQQIAKKLKKREDQKSRYTKKLKILNKKQGDIIAAISHEFKNPIAAIMGYAQTLQEDNEIEFQTRNRFLDKIHNNAYKISNMIDRLSMAVKLDNDDFKPKFSKFSLKLLVEDVKETLLQKHIDKEIFIDIEEVMLYADKAMIENLFINLIDNGLKYSENEVRVYMQERVVFIEDKGVGIASSDLENITKRFFRVGDNAWDNSIGVGLYIVKFILKLHSTDLQIKSIPGEGSLFYFDLSKMIAK